MPRNNSAVYTALAAIITVYALWITGYDLWLLAHSPRYVHPAVYQNAQPGFLLALQPVAFLMNMLVWWAITALGWVVRADHRRRGFAA